MAHNPKPIPYSLYNVKVLAIIGYGSQENGIFCDDFFLCVKNTFCVRTQKSWHKKHSQNTCNSQEKCLSLHSLSWKQSLYLRKRLIPIEVKSGSLWRSSLFFCSYFKLKRATVKRNSGYASKFGKRSCLSFHLFPQYLIPDLVKPWYYFRESANAATLCAFHRCNQIGVFPLYSHLVKFLSTISADKRDISFQHGWFIVYELDFWLSACKPCQACRSSFDGNDRVWDCHANGFRLCVHHSSW